MRERSVKIEGVGLGASSKAAFTQKPGYLRRAINVWYDGQEAMNRNGTHLRHVLDGDARVEFDYDSGTQPIYPGTVLHNDDGGEVFVTEVIGSIAEGTIRATVIDGSLANEDDLLIGDDKVAEVSSVPVVYNRAELTADHVRKFINVGDMVVSVAIEDDAPLLSVINAAGEEVTVQFEGVVGFKNGGGMAVDTLKIGDVIQTDGNADREGVVLGVTIYSGAWSAGTAEGVIRYRKTGTEDFADEDDIDVVDGGSGVCEIDGAVDLASLDYLTESDAETADLKLAATHDTVFLVNSKVAADVKASPYTGEVLRDFIDYETMARRNNLVEGGIYQTIQSSPGNAAGYFICTAPRDPDQDQFAQFVRIPKPDQEGAVHDGDTMPHTVVIVDENTVMYGRPPWAPRLSGGDVRGRLISGENLILNKSMLEGRRIIDLALHGNDRLALLLSDSAILASRSGGYFDFWLNDIFQTVPSDRIHHEIVIERSGAPLSLTAAGGNLFIATEHAQIQFGPALGGVLSAGGEGGGYNGRMRLVSRYESHPVLRPVASGSRILAADASGRVHQYGSFGDASEYSIIEIGPPITDIISEDISSIQFVNMALVNSNVYCIASDDSAWVWQVKGVDDTGAAIGAWAELVLHGEKVRYIWGDQDVVRLIVTDGEHYTEQWMHDRDAPLDEGVGFDARLDRRQSRYGVYDELADQTVFQWEGSPDEDLGLQVRAAGAGGRHPGEVLDVADYHAVTGVVRFRGDLSGAEHYIGRRLSSRVRFPDLWFGMEATRTLLTRIFTFHDRTSDYRIRIARTGRSDKTYRFAAKRTGSYRFAEPTFVDTGKHEARVGGTAKGIGIWIESDTGGQWRISGLQAFYEAGGI